MLAHAYIHTCVCVCMCADLYVYYTSALSQQARTDRGWPGITKGRLNKVAQARTITSTRAVYMRRQSQLRNATALFQRVFFPACATGRAGAGRPPSLVRRLRRLPSRENVIRTLRVALRQARPWGRTQPRRGSHDRGREEWAEGGARADSHTDAERARFRSGFFRSRRFRRRGVGAGGGAGCYFFLAWSISMRSVCDGALPLICL